MAVQVPAATPTNISVDQLARDYATRQLQDQQLAPLERQILHRRVTYDAEVTAFNASTIATIATLAITLITGSIVWFILFAGCYQVRNAIEKAIDLTGAQLRGMDQPEQPFQPEFMLRVFNILPEDLRRRSLARELRIQEQGWQPNQYKLLDFVVWKNWTPRNDIEQAVQAMQHQQEPPQEQEIQDAQELYD